MTSVARKRISYTIGRLETSTRAPGPRHPLLPLIPYEDRLDLSQMYPCLRMARIVFVSVIPEIVSKHARHFA